ncbi:MDR family MFS transporter [Paenibacillus sp. OV219]|uniref:MDR family MFS transporter n=1 Tax=Paenibacillus sp. OV219 TaxID=1884377 RepID=UPI0008C76B3C|nr:MDR family MFS transporter [Paenibacillus sp. OV219]SEM58557.1 drug resistance transporter, EmrB/QacA subfamily [Paenibacillus sp. OV219]
MKQNNKTLILIGLMIGVVFSELDETVVSTAMPTILRDLGGLALYGWVGGVYMLAMTSFMAVLGKLADLYGRKKIYLVSMALFIGGSIISGLAPSMEVLLVGRGIQGIGAGGLMPLAMVIFGDTFPVEQRAKIQGLFGAVMFIPQLLGPLIGGFFVEHISWHWIFLVNIPVGVIAAIILSLGLQETKVERKITIDWAGAILLVAALISLLLTPVLHQTEGYGWTDPVILALMAVGAALLAVFIFVESRAKEPILPLHLFKNRNFVVLSALMFVFILGLMGAFASFPFFAQNVLGLSPTVAGYLSLPLMIGAIGASVVAGRFMTKVPYRNIYILSFILPIIAFYLLTTTNAHTPIIMFVMYFIILGLGFGTMFSNQLIVQESVEKEHNGIAQSSITLFQSIGMTIGFSVFGSVLAANITSGLTKLATKLPDQAAAIAGMATGTIPKGTDPSLVEQVKDIFAGAFHNLYWIAFVLVIVAFFICFGLKKEVLATTSAEKVDEDGEGSVKAV